MTVIYRRCMDCGQAARFAFTWAKLLRWFAGQKSTGLLREGPGKIGGHDRRLLLVRFGLEANVRTR